MQINQILINLKNVPTNLSNLKSKEDKLNVNKLGPVSVNLSNLSDAVKNDIVKKDICNTKIKNIEDKIPDITDLAPNTTPNAQINDVQNKIPSITILATTTALNAKINKVKNKIPKITNLDTTAVFTAVENKIPNHGKCITTTEFNMLTSENFAARLAQANLPRKNDISDLVKKTDFDDKLKNLINKLLEIKQNLYLFKMNLKNYRHLTQVFLLVKVTLIVMGHNCT